MGRNWAQWILSDEFMELADRAVQKAVAESDAAGLPRAYLHYYGEPFPLHDAPKNGDQHVAPEMLSPVRKLNPK